MVLFQYVGICSNKTYTLVTFIRLCCNTLRLVEARCRSRQIGAAGA